MTIPEWFEEAHFHQSQEGVAGTGITEDRLIELEDFAERARERLADAKAKAG